MQIVVATHNEGKLVEIHCILGGDPGASAENIELMSAGNLHLSDPVGTGVTLQENTPFKARVMATRTGLSIVMDDLGLIVDAMGSAPSILSARWAGAHGHDKASNALLLAQVEDIPDDERTACFRCTAASMVLDTETGADVTGGAVADGIIVHITAADGSPAPVHARYAIKSETVELGGMPGRIIHEARGVHGFGYDPLFVPDDQPAGRVSTEPGREGEPLTSTEMTPVEGNAISHRGKTLKALVPAIGALLH